MPSSPSLPGIPQASQVARAALGGRSAGDNEGERETTPVPGLWHTAET
jgi:hypothetical protein